MSTERQRRGESAEALAVAWLTEQGWHVVARNVRIVRDEVDVIAIDPGPPLELVLVEVRSATSGAFGPPEERVDRSKVRHLYRAAATFAGSAISHELGVAGLPARVDLVIVDRRAGRLQIRHLPRLEPA